ncbi:MAG: ATP-binding cassette domain-containing protein [Alphaproteobacteria bacterium]|nr:ATP-binding cassette domain-containing protein [Alphaproteobacteria bacterium]MDA7983182.1 ATP-binding cassette domain-containing protein [Alphaproteobacteria bacterium]MDA7988799.1 ATP-binding cassette domain-containing protein [Alphaproteobacteria bacterium]MDA8009250.1 ATP-binding cassette domain-containing protein [Alphaproteobacteria bacterium]
MTDATDNAPSAPQISAEGLFLSFGKKEVLKNFSLNIGRGESVVILGRSGCGKSVFLKCLLGLLRPDDGKLFWQNRDLLKERGAPRELRQRIGMLFQSSALFDSLTVWENVAFGLLATKRMNRAEAYDVAIERLAEVELPPETALLSPAELSGGMKKRVGLARAVATRPEILLFDEPTSGLDPIMTRIIDDLILGSVKSLGATAITVTHDMQSAARIADRVALLHGGSICWQGGVDALAAPENAGNQSLLQFVRGESRGPLALSAEKE